MGHPLPHFTESQFRQQLIEVVRDLPEAAVSEQGSPKIVAEPELDSLSSVLYSHYAELRRWNPRVSLVGPGTASEVVRRHYGESLAALPLIEPGDRRLIDVGSGAGFPGLVIAAARPSLEITLVEPKERKRLFLKTAVRRCGLSCRCLNARVERPLPADLPGDIDLVTCRALAISPDFFEVLSGHSPQARFLLWRGKDRPELPGGFELRREIRLAGSHRRRILEICSTRTWQPS